MAPRPQWKGYLKLSLVSCAVMLYPASTTTQRVSFNILNRATGNRVRRQLVDSETGAVVESESQVRGYEVGKGSYVLVEDDEIKSVAIESTHTIDIERFVKRNRIDPRYLDSPHYLAPDGHIAEQAFAVIRDAMARKGVIGIARVVLSRRERLLMLEPFGSGMLATTLRYAYELRDPAPYFEEVRPVEIPTEMLDLATHIIDTKSGDFDLAGFEDRYENALEALVREKQKGEPVKPQRQDKPGNVVDLMEALRRSLAGSQESGAGKAPRRAPPSEKGDGRSGTKPRPPKPSRAKKAG